MSVLKRIMLIAQTLDSPRTFNMGQRIVDIFAQFIGSPNKLCKHSVKFIRSVLDNLQVKLEKI